jgi:hypothetical protein
VKSKEYPEQDKDLICEERRIPWTGAVDKQRGKSM